MSIEELVLKELINRELIEKSNVIVKQIDRELDNINSGIKGEYNTEEDLNKSLERYLELVELRTKCLDINKLRQLNAEEFKALGLNIKRNSYVG